MTNEKQITTRHHTIYVHYPHVWITQFVCYWVYYCECAVCICAYLQVFSRVCLTLVSVLQCRMM